MPNESVVGRAKVGIETELARCRENLNRVQIKIEKYAALSDFDKAEASLDELKNEEQGFIEQEKLFMSIKNAVSKQSEMATEPEVKQTCTDVVLNAVPSAKREEVKEQLDAIPEQKGWIQQFLDMVVALFQKFFAPNTENNKATFADFKQKNADIRAHKAAGPQNENQEDGLSNTPS